MIDCIHEPRSTPTRVVRGNARAYWGARYTIDAMCGYLQTASRGIILIARRFRAVVRQCASDYAKLSYVQHYSVGDKQR